MAGDADWPLGRPAAIGHDAWRVQLGDLEPVRSVVSIDSTAQGLVTLAQNSAPTDASYYANVRILTPVAHTNGTPWTDGTSPQEYITVVSAPEPSSIALLGSGLVAFAFRLRKKRS